jgi:hypothetical protein
VWKRTEGNVGLLYCCLGVFNIFEKDFPQCITDHEKPLQLLIKLYFLTGSPFSTIVLKYQCMQCQLGQWGQEPERPPNMCTREYLGFHK